MERLVIVTGAETASGAAIALELASIGFSVLASTADAGAAHGLGDAARRRAVTLRARVGAPGADELARAWGLVVSGGDLNAGDVLDVEAESARDQLEADVLEPMRLVRLAVPGMVQRGEGRLVNVSTVTAPVATRFTGWHAAAASARRELFASLRLELAGLGVDVVEIRTVADESRWFDALGQLRARRARSADPSAYDRALRVLGARKHLGGDPARLAGAVAEALTAGSPGGSRRLGGGGVGLVAAGLLRSASGAR